jgi:hypothetical protein
MESVVEETMNEPEWGTKRGFPAGRSSSKPFRSGKIMTVTFQPAIRKVAVFWLALTCAGPLHARGEPTMLENARIAVSVDKQLGAIRSIRDKELDVS